MNRTTMLSLVLVSSCALAACGDGSSGSAVAGTAGTTAQPAKTAATATAATATATATATAAAAPAFTCPSGSTGEGTPDKPCKATGQTRVVDVKWTGKYEKGLPVFSVKNATDLDMAGADGRVYFYDKAGKQLDTKTFDGKSTQKYWWASGGVFQNGPLKKGESRDAETVGMDPKQVPKGTVNIEAELWGVSFKAPEGTPPWRWTNEDLKGEARPQAGKAPAGAQPAPPTAGK